MTSHLRGLHRNQGKWKSKSKAELLINNDTCKDTKVLLIRILIQLDGAVKTYKTAYQELVTGLLQWCIFPLTSQCSGPSVSKGNNGKPFKKTRKHYKYKIFITEVAAPMVN